MVFPVVMYGCELYCKESWAPKNWCFWAVVLEKTLESPLHFKGIQTVNPKGNQSWIFIGRTDAEAETPILWKPDEKNRLIGEDTYAGKLWRQEVKGKKRMRWLDGISKWWTWAWLDSGRWWWTGKPGVLQCMGSQRGRHHWATELNWQLIYKTPSRSCLQQRYSHIRTQMSLPLRILLIQIIADYWIKFPWVLVDYQSSILYI